jgi:hypothetical protein
MKQCLVTYYEAYENNLGGEVKGVIAPNIIANDGTAFETMEVTDLTDPGLVSRSARGRARAASVSI